MPGPSLDLTNISMPLAALLASLIGATATITASLIQLRMAWRKEMKARERREPVSKSNSRGPVIAVVVLMIASAIGGFALAQYFSKGRQESSAMDEAVSARLDELSAGLKRLEGQQGVKQTSQDASSATTNLRREEAIAATVSLTPCVSHANGQEITCTDKDAVRVAICAELPPTANIAGVERFVRDEGDTRSWADSRIETGQQPTAGLFSGEPKERSDSGTKQVCQEFQNWSNRGRFARILVKYAVP